MKTIAMKTIERLSKNPTLDEIKTIMKEECKKVTFEITNEDWNKIFIDIIYMLHSAR